MSLERRYLIIIIQIILLLIIRVIKIKILRIRIIAHHYQWRYVNALVELTRLYKNVTESDIYFFLT
jgi:hypothetical protein